MRQVRVGVIGCGRIGRDVHIPMYVENPKSKLVAISDTNKDILNRIGEKYGLGNCFTDYRDLIESDLVDAVSICTPTSTHSEIALAAADRGIHVLCEKPLASSMEEGERIVQAIRKSGIRFMVGFNYRFLPNHLMVKKIIDNGRIGKPLLIIGRVITAGPYQNGPSEIERLDRAKQTLGIFVDLGSHLADLFIWMMGQPYEVYGSFTTAREDGPVDDLASVLIRFRSGVLGNISIAWVDLPDYQAMADSRMIEIVGTRGKVESEFFGPSLFFYGAGSITSKLKGKIRITPSKLDPRVPDEALRLSYREEIDDFLGSITGSRHPSVGVEDGMKALALVSSAYESAKLKTPLVME